MHVRELQISGYRGFAQPETLRLALPNKTIGSGLTVLVGPNNAGKSAIIETLFYLRAPSRAFEMAEGQMNALANGDVRVRYTTQSGAISFATQAGGSIVWDDKDSGVTDGRIVVVPPRRIVESQFQPGGDSREGYAMNTPDFTRRQNPSTGFGSRLHAIHRNWSQFKTLLSRVLGRPPEWYIQRTEQGNFYLKVTSSSSAHGSDGLGQGVLGLLHTLDALYDSSPDDIIVLDEPELSLHPSAQRRLADLIAEYSTDRQIVVATHSPYFVPLEALTNGASVARVYLKERRSRIGQLSDAGGRAIAALLASRDNPHLVGLNAREVFFLEENVILVEGQEDVVAYRRIIRELRFDIDGSFYGWGVGGAGNMKVLATMLGELGVPRVVGILDAGQEELAAELQAAFPGYLFMTIPARDVRDKPARDAVAARKGLVGADGSVHPEFVDGLKEVLEKAQGYFAPG